MQKNRVKTAITPHVPLPETVAPLQIHKTRRGDVPTAYSGRRTVIADILLRDKWLATTKSSPLHPQQPTFARPNEWSWMAKGDMSRRLTTSIEVLPPSAKSAPSTLTMSPRRH